MKDVKSEKIAGTADQSKKKSRHLSFKMVLAGIFVLGFLGYVSVTLISQQMQISAKASELESIKQSIAVQEVKNEEIKNVYNVLKQLSRGGDSKEYKESLNYIERVAREDYGYSKQGERIFVNIAGE